MSRIICTNQWTTHYQSVGKCFGEKKKHHRYPISIDHWCSRWVSKSYSRIVQWSFWFHFVVPIIVVQFIFFAMPVIDQIQRIKCEIMSWFLTILRLTSRSPCLITVEDRTHSLGNLEIENKFYLWYIYTMNGYWPFKVVPDAAWHWKVSSNTYKFRCNCFFFRRLVLSDHIISEVLSRNKEQWQLIRVRIRIFNISLFIDFSDFENIITWWKIS